MKPALMVLLENIRSAYNVGSIFRTADSAGVARLYLTGYTAYPPHPKLEKTALGSLTSVPWEHHESAITVVQTLQKQGVRVLAAEVADVATSIYEIGFTEDTCLVFGNEVDGVSQELLSRVDGVVRVPMFGMKESLNVATAAGVVIYEFVRKRLMSSGILVE